MSLTANAAPQIDGKYIKDNAITTDKIAPNAVDLSTQTTGVLPVTSGGTGSSTSTGSLNSLLPIQTGNSGRFLTTDGTNASWGVVSGVTSLLSIGASPNAAGATISGNNLTLQPASSSFGGVVTTGAQTFSGAKSFAAPMSVIVSGGGLLFNVEAASSGDSYSRVTAGDAILEMRAIRDVHTRVGSQSTHPLLLTTSDIPRMTISDTGLISIHDGNDLYFNGPTTGSVGLKGPENGDNTSYFLPQADGSLGDVLTTDGSGVMAWSTPTVYANQSLSNLTSPTAINQDLIPQPGFDLGSLNTRWAEVNTDLVRLSNDNALVGRNFGDSADVPLIKLNTTDSVLLGGVSNNTRVLSPNFIPDGATANLGAAGNTWNLYVNEMRTALNWPSNNAVMRTADAAATNPITIRSGNASAGNSGDINLEVGTATGAQGDFIFQKVGVVNSIGDIWTATGTNGEGYWAAPPATGANTTLSNLTSPVAINQHLLPDSGITRDIGSTGGRFRDGFFEEADITTLAGLLPNTWGADLPGIVLNGDSTDALSGGASSVIMKTTNANQYMVLATQDVNLAGTGPSLQLTTGHNTGAGNSGEIYVESGAATSGNSGHIGLTTGGATAGNSGGISFIIGSAGSTQGNFRFFKSGQAPSIGDIWTATGTDGAGYWATPAASGANTALSNLSSVAINTSLLPGVSGSHSLGSPSFKWNIGYLNSRLEIGPSFNMMLRSSNTTPSGVTAAEIKTEGPNPIAIATANNAAADTTDTKHVLIETGNKTAGTGNSGDIKVRTGTSIGGSRGKIQFIDGTEGTAGHVWTSTDTAGSGEWATLPASGANTSLSNLITTAINTSLVPDANTHNLGSTATFWNIAYSNDFRGPVIRATDGVGSILNHIEMTGADQVAPNGVTYNTSIRTIRTGDSLGLWTRDGGTHPVSIQTGVHTSDTGALDIETGNSSGGNSGNLTLKVGTAGVTRGKIRLVDGSEGTTGHVWTSTDASGSGAWAAAPASGANTSLSNLTATSINQNLLPNFTEERNIGSLSLTWNAMYAGQFTARGPGVTSGVITTVDNNAVQKFMLQHNTPEVPSTASVGWGIRNTKKGESLAIFTDNNADADATATGSVYYETGNKTAGTGNSGDISLRIGTSSGGTRGKIKLIDGSEGTVGHVWTQSAADGTGGWAAPAGGGANTTLSNLTSPTAINQDFIFDTGTNATVKTLDNGAGLTRQLILKSGDAVGGDSGNIAIQSGTSSGGSRGTVTLDGSQIRSAATSVPTSADSLDLGNSSAPWRTAYINSIRFRAASQEHGQMHTAGTASASGTSSVLGFFSTLTTKAIGMWTNDGTSSSNVYIETGDASAGNSGSINLQTGTATGTRGTIKLADGSEGTAGHVWTSTDTAGNGAWSALPGVSADSVDSTHILLDNNTWLRWTDDPGGVAQNVLALDATEQLMLGSSILAFKPQANIGADLGTATTRWNGIHVNNVIAYTDVQPDTDSGASIGQTGKRFTNIFGNFIHAGSGTNIGGRVSNTVTTPSGATGFGMESIEAGRHTAVHSANNNTADANATGNLYLETGNKTAGTGNSGSIVLRPGTSTGGVKGNIVLWDDSVGTSGQCWVSQDASGTGAWETCPAGGANATLSNLTSPTAINQNLQPDTTGTKQLGASNLSWNIGYFRNLALNTNLDQTVLQIQTAQTMPSGNTATASLNSPSANQPIGIHTANNGAASATATPAIRLETGNKTAGTGDSGNIVFQPGTSAGGMSGRIENAGVVQHATESVSLTADNQAINMTRSTILLSSDSATQADRTFTLDVRPAGAVLTLIWTGTNAAELVDSGNANLSADWIPTENDTLQLISNGTVWLEVSRSAN